MVKMDSQAGFIGRASEIIGKKVVNYEGESVGEVKDLMVNYADGNVTYAIMSFGGILGIGDKLFAVPWVSLNHDRPNDRFIMKANKDLLQNAPGFDKSNWPDMSDPTRQSEIYRYYNEVPRGAESESWDRQRGAAD